MTEETKTLTVIIEVPITVYNRIKNIINLGDLLEKALQDRITRLLN